MLPWVLLLLASWLLVAAVAGAALFIFLKSPVFDAFLLLLVGFLEQHFPTSRRCILLVVATAAHITCPCHLPHGSLSAFSLSLSVIFSCCIDILLLHHPSHCGPLIVLFVAVVSCQNHYFCCTKTIANEHETCSSASGANAKDLQNGSLLTSDRLLDFCAFIPFLQYIQSVFSKMPLHNRGFGSEGLIWPR